MYNSIVSFAFLTTLVIFVLLVVSLSLYFSKNEIDTDKKRVPWLAIFLYVVCIGVDWFYSNLTQLQTGVMMTSWSAIFPIFSYFYGVFSIIAVCGIYYRSKWGFNLAYATICSGFFAYTNSYLIIFKDYPFLCNFFLMILILNFIVIVYLAVYSMHAKLNGGP